MDATTGWLLLLLLSALFGFLVALGVGRHVVVYYDTRDLAGSTASALLLCVGFFALKASFDETSARLTWLLVGMAAAGAGLWAGIRSISACIVHNRSRPVGVVIGVFKIAFAGIAIAGAMASLSKATDPKEVAADRLSAALNLFLFALIAYALINGPDVYARRGWVAPRLAGGRSP